MGRAAGSPGARNWVSLFIDVSSPCHEISRHCSMFHLGTLFFSSVISILEFFFLFFSRTLNKQWSTASYLHLPESWVMLQCGGRMGTGACRYLLWFHVPSLSWSPGEATSKSSSCWQRNTVVLNLVGGCSPGLEDTCWVNFCCVSPDSSREGSWSRLVFHLGFGYLIFFNWKATDFGHLQKCYVVCPAAPLLQI